MKIVAAAAALVVLTLSLAVSSASAEHVVVLVGETAFEKAIKENPFIVVEFYAPWCGHCKTLAPQWESAAKTLKDLKLDTPIVLANVDATEEANKALASKYGVKGFPTIKIFRDGSPTPSEYDGPREAAGIVSFLKKQGGPAVSTLADAATVTKFRTLDDEKDVVVVGVFPDGAKSEEAAAFTAAGTALRNDYDFGLITDASLLAEAKGAKGAFVVIFKSFTEPSVVYTGALTKDELVAWVEATATPSYAILDQNPKNRKVLQKVFADPKPKVLAFASKGEDSYEAMKEALTTASATLNADFNFIFVDNAGNGGALEHFGLKVEDSPAFCIHEQSTDAKFVNKKADPATLVAYLTEFKAGKLKKSTKSEAEPEKNDGPVTILTSNNFDDHVTLGKNVMIEFYAPWCGHCKTLAPIYEKVGAVFKDDATVVVAKMDATANDIPDTKKYEVKGFPTLVFVTADGTAMKYEGDRSEEALVKYIRSHADSSAEGVVGKVSKDEL